MCLGTQHSQPGDISSNGTMRSLSSRQGPSGGDAVPLESIPHGQRPVQQAQHGRRKETQHRLPALRRERRDCYDHYMFSAVGFQVYKWGEKRSSSASPKRGGRAGQQREGLKECEQRQTCRSRLHHDSVAGASLEARGWRWTGMSRPNHTEEGGDNGERGIPW